ncbi:response regulator transcription factor [Oscillochloris sp. ZM17-4]|uniref:response regulator transcription factor n=1 Tax=Oscillochloris sp. ZM17-4 TaxID=2866714 RepID=UPI001C72CAE6|nr:response regulator transcription factor [Oscillochloris sp. ZM17-4]MBX0330878.1 response regulator transcription factor [Oscillochloris sp. ZM17-4]
MPTVLIIDDDERLTGPMRFLLEAQGFAVLVAGDGAAGLRAVIDERPDVVLLDIMLPAMDGWQVCQEIRRFSQVPIIMLSALGMELDRIRGLELGADDYLTKPFASQELIAHIRSILRRVQWDTARAPDSRLVIGRVRLDLAARRAYKGDVELALRHKEYELLSLLMQQAGSVLTREQLFSQIWGTDWMGDTRTLDVHIRWLRQKIEDDPSAPQYIQTVRNVGYRFAGAREAT